MIQTLFFGALTLAASAATQDADDYPVLLPGQSARVQLGPLTDGYPTWRIDVPPGTTSMRLWTTGATDDLSLHLTSEYPTDPGFADLTGPDVWLDEELLVTVNDGFPLYPGEWYVTISEGTASRDPDSYVSIRAQLHLEFPEPARAVLVPNEIVEIEVTMEQALRAVLSLPDDFDPPRRSTWQVELYGPDLDADLLVGPAAAAQTLDYPYGTSSRTIGYERVTFRGRQADNLAVLGGLRVALDEKLGWERAANKLVVIIGDAPAHPHDQAQVEELAREANRSPFGADASEIIEVSGDDDRSRSKRGVRPFIVSTIGVGGPGVPTQTKDSLQAIATAGGGAYAEVLLEAPADSEPPSTRIVKHILTLAFGSRWASQMDRFLDIYLKYRDAGAFG